MKSRAHAPPTHDIDINDNEFTFDSRRQVQESRNEQNEAGIGIMEIAMYKYLLGTLLGLSLFESLSFQLFILCGIRRFSHRKIVHTRA